MREMALPAEGTPFYDHLCALIFGAEMEVDVRAANDESEYENTDFVVKRVGASEWRVDDFRETFTTDEPFQFVKYRMDEETHIIVTSGSGSGSGGIGGGSGRRGGSGIAA